MSSRITAFLYRWVLIHLEYFLVKRDHNTHTFQHIVNEFARFTLLISSSEITLVLITHIMMQASKYAVYTSIEYPIPINPFRATAKQEPYGKDTHSKSRECLFKPN